MIVGGQESFSTFKIICSFFIDARKCGYDNVLNAVKSLFS